MPVSEIVNRNAPGTEEPASGVTRRATSPDSVNLIALPSKLSSTCRSRVGSPTRSVGTSGAISHTRARPFSWARTATISVTFSSRSFSENPVRSSSSCEASTLERSRMSLMRFSRLSPARRKICTYLSCSGERGGLREQVRDADDRIHRRSDFMAHARQKIRLGLARALGHGLGLLQFRLHPLALGDVARRGEDALQRAAPVVKGGRVVGHHRLLPVAGARRQLVVGDLLFAQHELDPRFGPLRIGEVALEWRADQLVARAAGSASICLLTSVMMPEGSVVISASMLDSISERV